MNVSSAVTGQAVRPSRPSWPRSSGLSAGLWVINPVSWQRCQSETPLSGTYQQFPAGWTSPLPLPFRFHGNTDFEPAIVPSWSGICFHFSLLVLILSPCFILSRLSQKIQYSTWIPQRASWPWFQYTLFCISLLFLLLIFWHLRLHPANCYNTTTKYTTIYWTSSQCP